jgi:hypothetical protein
VLATQINDTGRLNYLAYYGGRVKRTNGQWDGFVISYDSFACQIHMKYIIPGLTEGIQSISKG